MKWIDRWRRRQTKEEETNEDIFIFNKLESESLDFYFLKRKNSNQRIDYQKSRQLITEPWQLWLLFRSASCLGDDSVKSNKAAKRQRTYGLSVLGCLSVLEGTDRVFLITTLTCDDNFIRPQKSFSETHSESERVDFHGVLKWTKTGECNRSALTGHGEAARRHESLPLIQRSKKDEVIAAIFKASHLSLWRNPQHAGRRVKSLKCQRTRAERKLQIHSFRFPSPLAAIQGQSRVSQHALGWRPRAGQIQTALRRSTTRLQGFKCLICFTPSCWVQVSR